MPSSPNQHAAHSDDRPTDVGEQRSETAAAGGVGPSMPAMPESMTRGAGRGALIGAVIGALLLSPIAFISFGGDLAFGARLVIVALIGMVAGGAVGAVFFGGAVSETENPESDGDDSVVPDRMHRR